MSSRPNTVTFPQKSLGSTTLPAPTDSHIARYSSAGGDGLWLIVMEMAYAKARGGAKVDAADEIGEGGQLYEGVRAMAGGSTDTDMLSLTSLSTTKKKLTSAFSGRSKKIVTAAIMSDNDLKLPSGHAYTVTGWDGTLLTIRNPWGSNPTAVPNRATGFVELNGGMFTMTLKLFDDVFSDICYQE